MVLIDRLINLYSKYIRMSHPLLKQIENKYSVVRFSEEPGSPPDVFDRVPRHERELYVGMTLTSAGARDLVPPNLVSQKLSRIISLNSRIVERVLIHLLKEQNVAESTAIILPYLIGGRSHSNGERWSEVDYNFFWSAFLLGLDVQFFRKLYQNSQASDFDSFSKKRLADHSLSRQERQCEYDNLFQFITNQVDSSSNQVLNPVDEVWLMVGSSLSLGCNLERKILEWSGIPAWQVVFSKQAVAQWQTQLTPEDANQPELAFTYNNLVWRRLRQLLQTEPVSELADIDQPLGLLSLAAWQTQNHQV